MMTYEKYKYLVEKYLRLLYAGTVEDGDGLFNMYAIGVDPIMAVDSIAKRQMLTAVVVLPDLPVNQYTGQSAPAR